MHKRIGIWLDSMYISQNQGFQPPDQVIPGCQSEIWHESAYPNRRKKKQTTANGQTDHL